MLEPITALSVACSVLQIVDFAGTLISKGKKYYESADGSLVEHQDQAAAAAKLGALAKTLGQTLPSAQAGPVSSEEHAVRGIARDCNATAAEFVKVLNKLSVGSKHRAWASIRQAIKSEWSKDGIATMQAKLASLREQMVIHLLVILSQRQMDGYAQLAGQNVAMEMSIIDAVRHSSDEMKAEVSALSKSLTATNSLNQHSMLQEWQVRNQQSFAALVGQFSQAAEDQNKSVVEQMIIDSIRYAQITERRSKIPEAHAKTFRWVFKEKMALGPGWTNFAEWCRDCQQLERLFWISGKPGSGKSTLMRFLQDDDRTTTHLRAWAGDRTVITANCFFWNPGTKLQKSQAGLLRSLLHGLLQQCPQAAYFASPWRWRSHEMGLKDLDPWALDELLAAFRDLINHLQQSACVCLFIDGLDEFEGDDESRSGIISLFKDIIASPHVKVCISSRPWLMFRDAFEKSPKLELQYLTRGDIRNYVEDMPGRDVKFQKLMAADRKSCEALVLEVVSKAQGVFLWVMLVVRSLRQGLRNEDRFIDLQRRLHSIPSDLEEYFTQIFSSIDPFYQHQAVVMFRLALSTLEGGLSLMTLSFLQEEDPDFTMKISVEALNPEQARSRMLSTCRRLEICTRGFLEAYYSDSASTGLFRRQTVDFLHRTVRDFLLLPEIQASLGRFEQRRGPYDLDLFLFKANLAQLKLMQIEPSNPVDNSTEEDFIQISGDFITHAEAYGLGPDRIMLDHLVEFDMIIRKHRLDRSLEVHEDTALEDSMPPWHRKFQKWSLGAGVIELARPVVSLFYTEAGWSIAFPGRQQTNTRSLLDYAANGPHSPIWVDTPPNVTVIGYILVNGGDPNEPVGEYSQTVWSRYLLSLRALSLRDNWALKRRSTQQNGALHTSRQPWEPFVKTAKLFLEYGATRNGTLPQSIDSPFSALEEALGREEAKRLIMIGRQDSFSVVRKAEAAVRHSSKGSKSFFSSLRFKKR